MQSFLRRQQTVTSEQRRQLRQRFLGIRQINFFIVRHCQIKHQRPQIFNKFRKHLLDVLALFQQQIQRSQRLRQLPAAYCSCQLMQCFTSYDAQHLAHSRYGNTLSHDAALVQQAQRITHAALSLNSY